MHSEMQVSASASKKNQVTLPVCTFYMCEIQCLIFELYTNMVGGGQISHNSSIKCFFVQVSSCITTWKGCTLKFLTFIFLHWFMQCPIEDFCFLQHSIVSCEPLFMYII